MITSQDENISEKISSKEIEYVIEKPNTPSTNDSAFDEIQSNISLTTKEIRMLKKSQKTVPKFKKRILKLQDFIGNPDKNSPYKAHVYWNITYTYFAIYQNNGVKINPTTTVNFCKNSWFKKDSLPTQKRINKLLQHEQGHFDIGTLCALDFKNRVMQKTFSKNSMKEDLQKIFNQTLREYLFLEKCYDEETNHHRNKENQIRWNIYINNQLNKLYFL